MFLRILFLSLFCNVVSASQDRGSEDPKPGRIAKVKEILSTNGDVNQIINSCDRTPLMSLAWYEDQAELIEQLLTKKADPNLTFDDSALSRATFSQSKSLIALLLKYGADINLKYGWYVKETLLSREIRLHLAYRYYKIEILEFLLQNGADPNLNYQWTTPLHDAIDEYAGNNSDIAKYKNTRHKTLHQDCITKRNIIKKGIQLCLKYSKNKEQKDSKNRTALDLARELGLKDMVKFFETYQNKLIVESKIIENSIKEMPMVLVNLIEEYLLKK